jgi:Ser/Thr protein kinase RdoA (MazF antagonist)
MLSLIDRYLQLAPAMVPSQLTEDVDIHSPTLGHPDLHPNNIFVNPESNEISHVIDWQSVSTLPLFTTGMSQVQSSTTALHLQF